MRRVVRPRNRHTAWTRSTSLLLVFLSAFLSGCAGTADNPRASPTETTLATRSVTESTSPSNGPFVSTVPTETASLEPSDRSSLAPTVVYLADLPPVSGAFGWAGGAADVNGERFMRSIAVRVHNALKTSAVEYNLGRDWQRLIATIGMRDDSPSLSKLRFQVFADNRRIYEADLGLGQARTLDLDIVNMLRLKLVVNFLGPDTDAGNYYAVWGDARLEQGAIR